MVSVPALSRGRVVDIGRGGAGPLSPALAGFAAVSPPVAAGLDNLQRVATVLL
jgi:hypothetical protein